MIMAAETSTKPCLNNIELHKTESVTSTSSSSSSSDSSLSTASGKALLALSKTELDRLIAENMTSVLKTLKKRKHAKKHARLRNAAAASVAEGTSQLEGDKKEEQESTPPSVQTEGKMNRKEKKESRNRKGGKSRQKHDRNNGAQYAVSESKTKPPQHSLKEVQRDMKQESTVVTVAPCTNGACNGPFGEKTGKENKTINAFQLMMKARSKCIGSNSPGKEREERELSPTQELAREKKAIRNLQLEQWAAQKGAGKRRLQEEAEEDYIEHQMKKRAKRLKKLIGNMNGEIKLEEEEVVPKVEKVIDVLEIQDSPMRSVKVEVPKQNVKSTPKHTAIDRKVEEVNVTGSGKKRGRPRKTITAVEQTIEQEMKVKDQDASDVEFLVQLSSPRKKKDSLLGYFAKLTPETKTKQDSPSIGKAQKTPTTHNATPVVTVLIDDENSNGMQASTPPSQVCSRPRRSCANRIKDYSAFEKYSPAKEEQKSHPTRTSIVTPLKIINVQSPNAMKVVKSPSLRMFSSGEEGGKKIVPASEWPLTPKSVKLAPVFSRGKSQQAPQEDPEKVRARQLFLMSGIPEKLRQEMEKRTMYEEYILNESSVFPLVSHVMQLEEQKTPSAAREILNFDHSAIKLRPVEMESPPAKSSLKGIKNRKIQLGMFTGCSEYDYDEAIDKCIQLIDVVGKQANGNDEEHELPEVQNVKDIVRDYKQRFPHFPVFRCYKQFRAVYQEHQQPAQGDERQQEQCTKPNGTQTPLDESFEIIEPTLSCRNGETLFTEKYKPQTTEQILINFSPSNMLTQFLSLWKEDTGGQKRSNEVTTPTGHYFLSTEKGEDDFLTSNDSNSSLSVPGGAGSSVCNHVVLVGPPGCGKTSNVYAVANDMNFNVLELNASSRRKGKIILQELLEATQSHQVRQKSERSNSTDGLLVNGAHSKRGKKNGLNGLFSCLERRPSFTDGNGNGSKKLSLILIEDADIVFEQDDGFLAAINALIASSKRPIVLTTTNPSCTHMARYMARNNVIRYVAPGIGNVAKFFSLLALVERIPIDQHDIGRLYAHNGKDMRKTLNELQFFIQSGGDMERFPSSTHERNHLRDADSEEQNTALNETREEEDDGGEQMIDEHTAESSLGQKKKTTSGHKARSLAKQHHGTLYELYTRNQNESVVLRIPLDFNVLWCNMELVLRTAAMLIPVRNDTGHNSSRGKRNSSSGKRGKRGSIVRQDDTNKPADELVCEELCALYENISHAEAGWGVTQRNRIRYGKDVQDEQQQQQLAHDIGHALVEGSWIEWFSRRKDTTSEPRSARKASNGEKGLGTKAYDALRKLEQEPRQTIASYIGVSGIRPRVAVCDYEPFLRQICRHERDRSSTERRGSRFYHYLRNFNATNGTVPQPIVASTATMLMKPAGGFSVDHFDALSHCFEEQQTAPSATMDAIEK
ncbi:enhanced level of genomic instability 1 [Anopheles marshallii]|uniref:enhanced level of genomic instability 1 n=1 Tax=Anopheles marshallii TaxID=1521116 RepID=UPI00237AB8B2|nr:enhanced level of genomic instability 1 [Anopheles marshallii]